MAKDSAFELPTHCARIHKIDGGDQYAFCVEVGMPYKDEAARFEGWEMRLVFTCGDKREAEGVVTFLRGEKVARAAWEDIPFARARGIVARGFVARQR